MDDAFGHAGVAPVAEGSRPAGLVAGELFAEVAQLADVPEQSGGGMPFQDRLEVLWVGVVGDAEIEPACSCGHVTGAEGVEQAVEERGICGAFGRGYPDLGLDAGEVQSRVHGRCHAVEDQFAGLDVQAERLIDGEFVHLRAMAGHFGHGQRADEAAVAETLLHPAVGKPRLEGERSEP